MSTTKSKPTLDSRTALKIGTGVGLIATAMGAYFLYGSKDGARRRKEIKGWMLKVKGDILQELEGLKEVNQEAYDKVVDSVIKRYKGIKGIEMGELAALGSTLKSYWSKTNTEPKKRAARKNTKKKEPAKSVE